MSTGSVRGRLQSLRFDTTAAAIGLVLAVAMFPLRFVASQIYIRTIPIVLGTACLLYLVGTYREDDTVRGLPTLSRRIRWSLPPLVFLGLGALVVIAVHAGKRSFLFFDVAGLIGTLLFVQIAFAREEEFDVWLVLGQIVLLAFVLRFAALYTTPGLIGIDSWTHITQIAGGIRAEESLSAISNNKHYTSPLYHLLVVATSLLADVSLRTGLYLSLGVVMPISVILVFASGSLLVDRRWAALATLLYSLGDYVIEWGLHLIPTSMGLVLFLGVLYWLLRLMRTKGGTREFGMLVAFTVAVILTHQVSSFIMLVLLGAGVLSYLILQFEAFQTSKLDVSVFRAVEPVNLVGLLGFDIGLSTFLWSFTPYNGNSFLVTVLSYLRETLASSAGILNLAGPSTASASGGAASQAPTLVETIATYVDTLGFLLLLFGTFVGCLYVIHRNRARQSSFTLLLSAAVMLVFVLGLPLFGVRNFIPQRWFAFLYAPLAILAVIGLRYLTQATGRPTIVAVLLVFALVFPSTMVMSSNGAIDNPVFEDQEAKLSYTQSELAAVDTIGRMTGSPQAENIRPDQVLFTDHPYQTVFKRTGSYPAAAAQINDSEPAKHDVVVYRQEQTEAATYFLNGNGQGEIRNVPKNRVCRPSMATVYTNSKVSMCVHSPATGS